ncbi:MAG: RNA polymerase sigma-54 factor, partial [Kiritimatiellae bacterium]|nr:RNA polymerase sigma-54 factor [Kiritimatiellia bacterium]
MQPLLTQVQSQRQTQVLAPQMRQSLEFLQAPMMELRTLIRRELEQNPVLEERPEEHDQIEASDEPAQETESVADTEMKFKEEFEQLARQDDAWRELFLQTASYRRHNAEETERRQHLFDSLTQSETLQEKLLRQLGLVGISESERRLATLIIGCVNEDGWLNSTLGEMAETTGSDIRDLERLLKMIQDMDPAGVG